MGDSCWQGRSRASAHAPPTATTSSTDVSDILLAITEGAHVGNGYVAAWIKSLVGSQGPVQAGVEHVVGVFAGRNNVKNSHADGCMSWCDRAHKADLPSFTSTATLASLGDEKDPHTASAMDLGRAAYLRASATKDGKVHCVQTTYAHRVLKHNLLTEFRCDNQRAAAVTATLMEPGPTPYPAPAAELTNVSVPSGIEVREFRPISHHFHRVMGLTSGLFWQGVSCTKMQVKVGETDDAPRPIISECHTVCDGRQISLPAGQKTFFSCVSARHTSVDGLGAPTRVNHWGSDLIAAGADPTPLAISSWKEAHGKGETLFASHTAAIAEINRPGIEVVGDGSRQAIPPTTWFPGMFLRDCLRLQATSPA